MRLFLCLFCLAGAGIFVLVVPAEWIKLSHIRSGPVGLFYQSVSAFAVPLSLLVLKLFWTPFVVLASLIWSLWLAFLGFWILWNAGELMSGTGNYGLIYLTFVFVLALTTVFVTAVHLSAERKLPQNP